MNRCGQQAFTEPMTTTSSASFLSGFTFGWGSEHLYFSLEAMCRHFLFLAFISGLANGQVTLTNNGYQQLVVAIGENVAEDFSLVDRIKSVMTNASSYLYTATKRRAYFKDVTILVPETWSDRAIYEPRTIERFESAEIRIDEPVFPGAHSAYVQVSALKCGMPGIYMHITPFRLTDEKVRSL